MYYDFIELANGQCQRKSKAILMSRIMQTHPVNRIVRNILSLEKSSIKSINSEGDKLIMSLMIASIKLKVMALIIKRFPFIYFDHYIKTLEKTDTLLLTFIESCQLVMCRPFFLDKLIIVKDLETALDLILMQNDLFTQSSTDLEINECQSETWRSAFIQEIILLRKLLNGSVLSYIGNLKYHPMWYEVLLIGVLVYAVIIDGSDIKVFAITILIIDIILRFASVMIHYLRVLVTKYYLSKWKKILLLGQRLIIEGSKSTDSQRFYNWQKRISRFSHLHKRNYNQSSMLSFYLLLFLCIILDWFRVYLHGGL